MHGALLAAAIANRGQMPAPTLIDRAVDRDGRPIAPPVATPRQVVDAAAAREVGRMMELTTRIGTAKGTFRDKRGRRLLPFEVAGKTGTLSAETDRGYVGYSWFVGYAPAERPTIAFAVVLGNNPNWRIKATYVGRHIVSEYLVARPSPPAPGCWRQVAREVPRPDAARRAKPACARRDQPWTVLWQSPPPYRLCGASEGREARSMQLYEWLSSVADDRGSAKALVYRDTYLSWRGLLHRVDRRAQELHAMGIGPGSWVGLMLGNVPDFVILTLAVSKVEAWSSRSIRRPATASWR